MITKTFLRSFAGGEIAPECWGRLDLAKFQTGLATCRNFVTLPHGPAQNRAGFEYILHVKDSSKKVRLIPFAFNTTQTFALEFGDKYVRFHTQGGTLLETGKDITAITQANPGVVTSAAHGFSDGDWVFLSGIVGMTQLNGRYVKVANSTTDTFELTDLAGNDIDTSDYDDYTSGGTAARVYEVATTYAEADLFDIHYVQSADVLTLVHPGYLPRELKRESATSWTLSTISFVPTVSAPTSVAAAATGTGATSYSYKITTLAKESLEESSPSDAATVSNDLTTGSNANTITWTDATNGVRYNVYKLLNGLYGYIGQADNGTDGFVDDNITPDISQTPPINNDPFESDDNLPSAVGYFEQRRCFAGTNNQPQNFWATRSATESNLSYSIPQRDDDSIAFRIGAREVNTIRHIVPLSNLVLLTAGGEWIVEAANSDVLTPTSASPKARSFEGANNVQPPVAGKAALFAGARGGHVYEFSYQWEQNGYDSDDVSVLAPHLFDGYTIVDMAFARAPVKIMWAVRSDGTLLGLTYMPKQQVLAWHRHDTAGTFESVCSIAEDDNDALYAIVKRKINGSDVRYVERMHSRQFTDVEDAFFVDAGATYDDDSTTDIGGLWHLEGETVNILADGAVHPQQTVTDGAITLDQAASTVQVGLPITADLQTLPMSLQIEALGQGNLKNVNGVHLRVVSSSGIFAGPSFDDLTEVKQRTDEVYGKPPALKTDDIDLSVLPSWDADGQIYVRQSDPLPLTVSAMVLEAAVGG